MYLMNEAALEYSESKKGRDEVAEVIEQQIRTRAYQQVVVALLRGGKTISPELIQLVKKLTDEAGQLSQILIDSMHGTEKKKVALACQKGCDHCCRLKVVATEPELVIIHDYLLSNSLKADLEKTRVRFQDICLKKQQLEVRKERLAVQCGFLKEKGCSIYEVRPLACRAWNSIDMEACKRYLKTMDEEIPASICHYAPYDAIKKGISKGLIATGFETQTEELHSGILRLLGTP